MEGSILRHWGQVQQLHDQQEEAEDVEVVSPEVGVFAPHEAMDQDAGSCFEEEEDEGNDANHLQYY